MSNFKDLIGSRVSWEKKEGGPNIHLPHNVGFGSLEVLEIGERLIVSGDYGIVTTPIKSIVREDTVTKVTTQNSVYWISTW